jgi:hypothetical protein
MRAMDLKIPILLLLFTLMSCQSVRLHAVDKKIIQPGRQGGEIAVLYSTAIKVGNPVSIKKIREKYTLESLSFSITRLPDGLLIPSATVLQKGEYFINVYRDYTEEIAKTEDVLIFIFKNEFQKTITIEQKTTMSNQLLMK